jgi:hypothetical protein
MHRAVRLAAVLLILGGCAAGPGMSRVAEDTEGLAAPAPEMVGTWRGMAMATAGDLTQTTVPIELTIRPDGTWAWSKRGAEQASGRAFVRGDRVVLQEDKSTNTPRTVQLQRRGDMLWGVTPEFVPGAMNSVQLEKVKS